MVLSFPQTGFEHGSHNASILYKRSLLLTCCCCCCCFCVGAFVSCEKGLFNLHGWEWSSSSKAGIFPRPPLLRDCSISRRFRRCLPLRLRWYSIFIPSLSLFTIISFSFFSLFFDFVSFPSFQGLFGRAISSSMASLKPCRLSVLWYWIHNSYGRGLCFFF